MNGADRRSFSSLEGLPDVSHSINDHDPSDFLLCHLLV
jgi:hypothetical protein